MSNILFNFPRRLNIRWKSSLSQANEKVEKTHLVTSMLFESNPAPQKKKFIVQTSPNTLVKTRKVLSFQSNKPSNVMITATAFASEKELTTKQVSSELLPLLDALNLAAKISTPHELKANLPVSLYWKTTQSNISVKNHPVVEVENSVVEKTKSLIDPLTRSNSYSQTLVPEHNTASPTDLSISMLAPPTYKERLGFLDGQITDSWRTNGHSKWCMLPKSLSSLEKLLSTEG